MPLNLVNWSEKSLSLIRATMSIPRQLPHHVILEKAIFETGKLSDSSEIIFFDTDVSNISVLTTSESGLVENLLDHRLFYDQLNSESIQIRKLTPGEKIKANFQKATSHVMLIPLKEDFVNGLLVLGFNSRPSDIKGLIEFGEIVQNFFTGIFYLKSLQIETKKLPDTAEKNIFKRNKVELSDINKLHIQFQSFSFDPHISNQIRKKKKIYSLLVKSPTPSNTPLEIKKLHLNIISPIIPRNHQIKHMKVSNLQKRDTNLEQILKYLPVIFIRIGDTGSLLEIDGKGMDKLDLNENQHLGLKIFDLIPELDFSQIFFEKFKPKRLIFKKTKSGKLVVFDFNFFPNESNPEEIIGFGTDISDQYNLENKLKQAKKIAERARVAKSIFLAKQSHEIRTFIHSILGFAQLIKNNSWPDESEEYLDFIISSGEILLNILGNILDLTKIEEGKLELVEEPFNLIETMNSCLSPSQFQAKAKGLKFTVNFDEEFPKYFLGDGVKLIQIVVNLVSNSIKFTEKGEINISFSCLSKPIEGEKIKLRIKVSDTGIGISKSRQKKIFGEFSQADPSINRRFGGSGLGLSIVKELVKLMGGEIEVMSPGKISNDIGGIGSTFSLSINLQVTYPPSSDIENDGDKIDSNFNGVLKVLLVDDNYLNQRLASTILKNLGCEVTLANNGNEALLKLKNNDFHLIFMDVQMPVLDGYHTTRTIRENLKLTLPIIGLSANIYKEDIDLCYESGMDDYLGRPYTFKNFEEKVFKWAPQIEQMENLTIFEPGTYSNFGNLTDLDYLARVFNGDVELMKDLVQSFLVHHQTLVSDLKNAISSKDYDLIASLAHDIRSSLQTIGINSIIQILIDIEINAKEIKNDSELERLFSCVNKTSEAAILELKKFLVN